MNGALPLHGAATDLLFLAPALPYPPDRGDRLRWYHMLRYLGRRYRIHLGCFADPRRERAHIDRVRALCYETCFVEPPPPGIRMRSLRALARGDALALPAYRSAELEAWAARLRQRHPVQGVLACSVRMAGYLPALEGITRVIDLVDVESEKLRRAAAGLRWPRAALWEREAAVLLAHERALARNAEHVLFASGDQAALFAALAPEAAHKALALTNGVDADYFSPHIVHRNPFAAGVRALVMAGAMDDWANAAAAEWFAREVFAPLRATDPALGFYAVGARPGARVRALARIKGVTVTGTVPDVRPFLAHAALALAPLRVAHGMQNKVLEAMAMQKLVLATPQALAGLSVCPGVELLAADGAPQFAGQLRAALGAGPWGEMARAARARVMQAYGWQANLAPLAALFDGAPLRRASAS
jgi:sugar transferase (PEP-CTERM/EpsH1 system associated)